VNKTPAALIAGLVTALEEDLLPHLADASARASAFSMVQVARQLALSVAWDPAPLALQLAPRQQALAELARRFDAVLRVLPDISARLVPVAETAEALWQAVEDCDAYVARVVDALDDGSLPVRAAQRNGIERWIVAYCGGAVSVELQFMTRSHLGKLTRKTTPASGKERA